MARSIQEVAAEIRDNILNRRYPGNELPSERTLAEKCKASRQTVRLALEVLKSEGLITNVQGGCWQLTDGDVDATFAAFDGFLETVGFENRPGHVRNLVEFRRRSFIAGVDARLVAGALVTEPLRKRVHELTHLARAEWVLAAEDELMADLMVEQTNVVEVLAAQQLRRALARVCTYLDLQFPLYPNTAGFMELIAAWDAGDRPLTLRLADRVAHAREALYVRLMKEAPRRSSSDASATTH